MITPELLTLLQCPACRKGRLSSPSSFDAPIEELDCEACGASFPVRFGFPRLIPPGALDDAGWELWRRHLDRFQARRSGPRTPATARLMDRLSGRSSLQPAFAEFAHIEEGVVLDLGCGPGKFRRHFDPRRVTYVGLDPITLPEVGVFNFVQGVAEHLPFRNGVFTDIVILAALDHFRHLNRFVAEASRVLAPGGRLHVMQSVHEVRGPISALRVIAHKVKDSWDDRRTASYGDDVPKHLSEFTSSSLASTFRGSFEPVAVRSYASAWYAPLKMFMSLGVTADAASCV